MEMSEREKRNLKWQQTKLEMEKKDLLKEIAMQKSTIERLKWEQEQRDKTEMDRNKSQGTGHANTVSAQDGNSLAIGGDLSEAERDSTSDRMESLRSNPMEWNTLDQTNETHDHDKTEEDFSRRKVLSVDDTGFAQDLEERYERLRRATSFGDDEKVNSIEVRATTEKADLDISERCKRLTKSLTDSLERTRALAKAREEQKEKSERFGSAVHRTVFDSVPHTSTEKSDREPLSLRPYLTKDKDSKDTDRKIYKPHDPDPMSGSYLRDHRTAEKNIIRSSTQDSSRIELLDDDAEGEERSMTERVKKLEFEERILDQYNKKNAAEERERKARLEELRLRRQAKEEDRKRAGRISALRDRERVAELRLREKLQAQIEYEKRLDKLRKEEDALLLEEKQQTEERHREETERLSQHIKREAQPQERQIADREIEPYNRQQRLNPLEPEIQQINEEIPAKEREFREETSRFRQQIKREFQPQVEDRWTTDREYELDRRELHLKQFEAELQQREDRLKQAAEINERILEEQALKEQELNRREEYLRKFQNELLQKEEEIRAQLNLNSGKLVEPESKVPSSEGDRQIKDLSSTAPKQNDDNTSAKTQKEISPFVKPYINFFSGAEPVPKNESTFEEWKVEIDSLRKSPAIPEYAVKQILRNSLKGDARKTIVMLGSDPTTEQMIEKLERTFGNVASGQSVLQEFFTAEQKENESVALWGIRLEEIYRRAVNKGFASTEQRDKQLIERFWRSLRSIDLQNATSVYYHSATSFESLKQKVRSEEYAMAAHKSALAKGTKKETDRSSKFEKNEKPTLLHSSPSLEKSDKVEIQHQPVLQDPVTFKMVKDLAKEVESMKKLLEQRPQFPLFGNRRRQFKGKEDTGKNIDKGNTVPKHVTDDAKKQSSNK